MLGYCSRGCQEGQQIPSRECDLSAAIVLDNGLRDVSQNVFFAGAEWRWVHNKRLYVSVSCPSKELQSATRLGCPNRLSRLGCLAPLQVLLKKTLQSSRPQAQPWHALDLNGEEHQKHPGNVQGGSFT